MPKTLPIVFLLISIAIIVFALTKYSPIPVSLPGLNSNPKLSAPEGEGYRQTPYTGPRPETVIVNGPRDWEEVTTTPVVIFQFVAIWDGDFRDIIFETKVDEIDKDWRITYTNSRTVQLLPGNHTYHFSVRAKTKDCIEDYTPATRTFIGKTSQYVAQIKIISLSPNASPQKLILYNSGSEINITDWMIETSFKTITISNGVRIFRSDSQTIYQNIVLKNGDYLVVVGQTNPLGFNFYLNRCFGYLSNFYDIGSIIQKDCPRPSATEISYLSSACQQFINNLGTCQIPSSSDINYFDNDATCRQFLSDYYNYNACVNLYQSRADFFKNEWYVFAQNQFADINHDRIILRDDEGLVVDVYQY